jgi:hypothetical protein
MLVGKMIEIAFESAPGAALQAAIVLSGYWSSAAVVSVGISCMSTGFTTSMMAFELDTSPAHRKFAPHFFGYIPDNQRLLVLVELFSLHTAHSMIKTSTIALLAQTNARWLLAYLALDHFVHIMYKTARGDLMTWMPGKTAATAAPVCVARNAQTSQRAVMQRRPLQHATGVKPCMRACVRALHARTPAGRACGLRPCMCMSLEASSGMGSAASGR